MGLFIIAFEISVEERKNPQRVYQLFANTQLFFLGLTYFVIEYN